MATNHYAKADETQPGYPILPSTNDTRWQPMVTHARSREESILGSLPRLKSNFPIATVHAGDVVYLMPQVRYGVWVAAKVDYNTGWLNTLHFDFMPYESETFALDKFDDSEFAYGDVETEPYPMASPNYQAAQQVTDDFIDQMRELGTELDQPQEEIKPEKKEVNRIIGYLKGLFGR